MFSDQKDVAANYLGNAVRLYVIVTLFNNFSHKEYLRLCDKFHTICRFCLRQLSTSIIFKSIFINLLCVPYEGVLISP